MGSLGPSSGPEDLDVDALGMFAINALSFLIKYSVACGLWNSRIICMLTLHTIIGAGFSGISTLHRLRALGLKSLILESGTNFGGVWYHNRYPGARVDSEFPFYQLNIPEAYSTYSFTERFPGHAELRGYMHHLDNVLGLRKDTLFNAHVTSCVWAPETGRWTVTTKQGHTATGRYLLLCTGLLHRRHYPDFPGLGDFKGEIHHSGFWPEDLSTEGKKVALVGAGATAVQITQEIAKAAAQLTIFMRRPSYCLPMGQRKLSELENRGFQTYYDTLLKAGRESYAGFPTPRSAVGVGEVGVEERERRMQDAWTRGGFQFMTVFNDVAMNKESNKVVYEFWSRKVRERMRPGKKRDLMAPVLEEMPYWFGTKRAPLEQDYYECVDRDSVDVVNMNERRIERFTERGLVYEDGGVLEFDILVLATGFDSFSGSLSQMGLMNKEGRDIKDVWGEEGIAAYLGMTMNGFPNAFMIYSPQAPTALSNGPTIIEAQADMITSLIKQMEEKGIRSIDPKPAAQSAWCDMITAMSDKTLFPLTNSWWTGANVPGKKVQMLTYIGGINTYEPMCQAKLDALEGFDIEYWPEGQRRKAEELVNVVEVAEQHAVEVQ